MGCNVRKTNKQTVGVNVFLFSNKRAACPARLAFDVNIVEICAKNTLFFECLTVKIDALPSSETSETAHPTTQQHLSEISARMLYESQISHSRTKIMDSLLMIASLLRLFYLL
jgi:hypothetical protein